jgi:hypothetical protein
MLSAVNFCFNAIDKKAIRPEQQCYLINNGLLFASNERVTLCHHIGIPIDCQPNAAKFTAIVKAAANANDIPAFTKTAGGKLSVRAGKLKSLIECAFVNTEIPRPEGIDYEIDGEAFIKCLRTLEPFIGLNKAHTWTNGILLTGNNAYATNNVTMVRYSTNFDIKKRIVLPIDFVRGLIAVKMIPIKIRYCDKSITVFYDEHVWVKGRLLEDGFPKANIDNYFKSQSELQTINADFIEGLIKIKPFIDDSFNSVTFTATGMQTFDGSTTIDIENMFCTYGMYNYFVLRDVLNIAIRADFSAYPKPVVFEGENIVGALVGIRRS